MSYYVFHATPHDRARIHKGSCARCRDGRGPKNQEESDPGAWSAPMETLAEAVAYIELEFPSISDTIKCPYCLGAGD